MHIIGIQIEKGCSTKVLMNLREGWYPFGDFERPTKENHYSWRNGQKNSDYLYQLNTQLPQISISSIVGKNGSGKTTLLDILYRIINNFSCDILQASAYDSFDLKKAGGLIASLYFEIDGNIGFIHCKDEDVELFYRENADGELCKITKEHYIDILPELFYTIGVNYSIYSMDFDDYPYKKNEWMYRLFNNEESYLVPLALTPYRRSGQIEMDRERDDANNRIMTLSILLHMDEKSLINDYEPVDIKYSQKSGYKEHCVSKLDSIMSKRGFSMGIAEEIMKRFISEWQVQLNYKNIEGESELIKHSMEALAFESAYLSFTYKSYQDVFNLGEIQKAEKRNKSIDEIANAGNYKDVVDRIRKRTVDSLTLNIYRILTFLTALRSTIFEKNGRLPISCLISEIRSKYGNKQITYSDVYRMLPPSFYECELFIKHKNENDEFELPKLSSGEKQMLYSNSAILYHIYNIANAKADTRIIPYKHINIVLDEVELYAHPEFQRTYIHYFISQLSNMHISDSQIRSVNLIIATHSPFVVSDIPQENILVLKEGKAEKIVGQTYCSNIYNLLKHPFFIEYPMGEMARTRLDKVVKAFNEKDNGELKVEICNYAEFYKYLTGIIADPIIKANVSTMVDSILNENGQEISRLLSKKEELKKQIDEIDKELKDFYEEN